MNMNKKRGLGVLAALAITALTLTACTPSGGGSNSASAAKTLTVYDGGTGAFTKNFNPLSPTVATQVFGMIYEPLFFFNSLGKTGEKPVPMLGTKYSFDETGTKLSVETRKGVKWSDGKPFTAKDVAFTMNLINRTPALNAAGNAPKAQVTDDSHVTLTFSKPSFSDAPQLLGHTAIVPEHIFKSATDPSTFVNPNPVGTGPMTMASFSSQTYLMKKNPKYWNADKVKVAAMRMVLLLGDQASFKLLSGGLDWTGSFIPDIKKVLGNKPFIKYFIWGSKTVSLATCSNAALGCAGPQTDPVVRQALSAAIDRQQVNKLAYSGIGTAPNATFVPPSAADKYIAAPYKKSISMSPDVSESDSLLTGDGWVKGSDGIYAKNGERLSVKSLVTTGYTDYISILQTIAQQMKAAGIDFTFEQTANQDLLSRVGLGNFQMYITEVGPGPTSDPYYIYSRLLNGASTAPVGTLTNAYGNSTKFSDPVVDKAIAVAGGTEDQEAKATAYETIQKSFVKNLPYIPVIVKGAEAEFSARQFTGWPSQGNQYAAGSSWASPDNEQVLLHLKAK